MAFEDFIKDSNSECAIMQPSRSKKSYETTFLILKGCRFREKEDTTRFYGNAFRKRQPSSQGIFEDITSSFS